MFLLELVKILAIVHVTNGERSYSIQLVAYEHKFSPQFYSVQTYQLVQTADRRVLNGSSIFRKDMNDFVFAVKVNVLQGRRSKQYKWFDYNTDVCKLLENGRKMPLTLVNYIFKVLENTGTLIPEKCPFKKGTDYNLKKLYFDSENFPPHIPEMELIFYITLTQRKFVFYESNATVAIVPRQSQRKPLLKGN